MVYMYYGSLGILVFKCGSQLIKEAKYQDITDEDPTLKKRKADKAKLASFAKNLVV